MIGEDTTRSACLAVRRRAAWIDRSHEGRIAVTGADRLGWLQGLLTNDVAGLRPGQGCYAAYLTPQGRMITDVRVLVRDEACWLDVPGAVLDGLLARLDAFVITEDVVLTDLTPRVARLAVHGPAAPDVVAAALGESGEGAPALAALPEHFHRDESFRQAPVTIAASSELGEPGFDLYVPTEGADALRVALESAGAIAMDLAAWHACRIEAGRPAFGIDMAEDTIPLEAGLEVRAISFTKGCYVGQEVIVRVRDRGQGRVARRLMRLVASAESPVPAAAVARGDVVAAGDRDVGRVTSAAYSPISARTVALAMIQRDHAVAGTTLAVRHGGDVVEVRADDLLPAASRGPAA